MACGAPRTEANKPQANPKGAKNDKKPPEPIAAATAAGESTHSNDKDEKVWRIAWKAAEVVATGDIKVGKMSGVSGELYGNKKGGKEQGVSSRFESETAEADTKLNRLILRGAVKISASNGVIAADRVEVDGNRNLYKATGHVSFEGESGLVGPMDSLFASSHTDNDGKAILDKVGTSENFFKK